jgi:hypothetical protein
MSAILRTAPDRLDFFVRNALFATYLPDGLPGFWAIYATDNRALARAESAESRIFYLAHGNVNGVSFGVSTNEDALPSGQIISRDLMARRGSQSVGFQQICDWIAPHNQIFLTETRTIRVQAGPAEGAVLDWTSVLQASETLAVNFGVTEDAFLLLRPVSALTSHFGGQMRNSLGDYGAEAMHGRAASWCGGIGVIAGQTVGFVLLDHPENPWHPVPWLTCANGLISPSPFAWRNFTLTAGRQLLLRYRLLVHSGYVDQGWADKRLAAFCNSR